MAKSESKLITLKKVKITNDLKVELTFNEKATLNTVNEEDGSENFVNNEYSVKSKYIPHDDLVESLKMLRKHALAICEISVDSKEIKDYTVNAISIQGTLEEKNARIVITIAKRIKRAKKPVFITAPQTSLFDPVEYPKCEDLVKLVKEVIKEVWLYRGGKHLGEEQLSLFSKA